MSKKIAVVSLFTLFLVISVAFGFSPAVGTQGRTECEKACKKAHDQCRQVAGADAVACKKAYDECLESCKAPTPSPEPIVSPSPGAAPRPTESPSPEAMPSPTASPSPEASPSPTVSPS